jgi:hypothetical protein
MGHTSLSRRTDLYRHCHILYIVAIPLYVSEGMMSRGEEFCSAKAEATDGRRHKFSRSALPLLVHLSTGISGNGEAIEPMCKPANYEPFNYPAVMDTVPVAAKTLFGSVIKLWFLRCWFSEIAG